MLLGLVSFWYLLDAHEAVFSPDMALTLCYGFLWLLNFFGFLGFPFCIIFIANVTTIT
jgi:hypothetical protein